VRGRLRRSVAGRQDGFTLIELLVAMVLVGVVAAAVYASFISGVEASSSRDTQARAQNDARMAMEEFTRDVRQAVSPDGLVAPVAAAPTATSIELWVDNNRSPTATTAAPKRVRYRLSGTNFVRQVLTGTTWSVEDVLASPVVNGSTALFTAVDVNGAATTIPGAVATLSLRLILGDRSGRAGTNTELQADVTLRNRFA
jgi:prepilin-type N-terminal cleavage/methylation domain-containing protein